jgi:PAS domain S-box-containing protein
VSNQLREPENTGIVPHPNSANAPVGRILVVDDEPDLKNVLVEALERNGYEVTGCNSGLAAVAELRDQDFDLLLTDLMMPEMDGISLLKVALEIDPHLVGIIVTGQGSIQTAVDAMQRGAFDYVLKPFRMQTLMPVLTRAMNVRHLKLENMELRETVAIHGLCQTIAFTLDTQTVLSKLADAALQQSDADEVSVLLPTHDGTELYVAAVRGKKRERLLGERIPYDQSIASWVARERQPVILNGEVHDERFIALWPRPEIRSAISVPMQVANKLVGIINLNVTSRLRPFTLGQMKALSILGSTAAAALESASLYAQVQATEEKYRSIFENATEGLFQSTAEGRVLTANPALARILGYDSPQEMITTVTDIGKQIYVDPEARIAAAQLQDISGNLVDFEMEAYRKGKEKIWLSMNRRTIRNENGNALYMEGSIENITERKQAEQALRESEARKRAILESAMECIITMDSAGRIVDWNPAAEKTFGYSQEEAIGQQMAPLIVPEHLRERHGQGLANYLETGIAHVIGRRLELSAKRRDASEFPIELTITRIELQGAPMFTGYLRDITDRKKAEARLAAQYAVTRALAESNTIDEGAPKILRAVCESLNWEYGSLWTVDRDAHVLRCSQTWHSLGHDADEFESNSCKYVFAPGVGLPGTVWHDEQPAWIADVVGHPNFPRSASAAKVGLHGACAFPIRFRSEILGVVEFLSRSIREPDPDLLAMMVTIGSQIGQFIERRRVEEALGDSEQQLRQSQKLEAIGQLAGGVAHDFNNLLTAINGYSSLALQRLDNNHPVRGYLEEVKKAGDRAANLTRQLLAFGRKQMLQPLALNLNDVVADMSKMLRRLIGEDIQFTAKFDPELKRIKADPGQIEQVLVNLVVNARDAMPQGGHLTIETANIEVDRDYAGKHFGVQPGSYVMLAISDTGTGMSEEIKARIFEPFFTTKEKGKGTGLGLSTVYGIVKQSGGNIWVYSEPGRGTSFKVYLQQFEATSDPLEKPVPELVAQGGSETILLVEDEDVVRGLARKILEQSGYSVLDARNGADAIRISGEHSDPIHLLLTDVVMPELSGKEIAERLTLQRPGTRVLFMSGYTDQAIVHHGVVDADVEFIQKPFTPGALARKVRAVLDRKPGGNGKG